MTVLPTLLHGVDFTCAPSGRKPITVATGRRSGPVVRLDGLTPLPTLSAFEHWLGQGPGDWLGGFDFPFGLPRSFVSAWSSAQGLAEPRDAVALSERIHAHCADRQAFQALVDGWGQRWGEGTRPRTLPHRQADSACPGVSSTSPLQTRYVPVGKMYFEGLSRLIAAGVRLPGLEQAPAAAPVPGDRRFAFEAWPGLLAHALIPGQSYKTDAREADAAKDRARLLARLSLVDALERGAAPSGLRLRLTPGQKDQLVQDAKGDLLDATLCLMQAAWGHRQLELADLPPDQPPQARHFGLPATVDPVEGWILTA